MTVLDIYVQTRASRTEIVGMHGDAIKIRVKSPPVDGAANSELVRFISASLKIKSSDISIVSGHNARRKRIRIAGDHQSIVETLVGET